MGLYRIANFIGRHMRIVLILTILIFLATPISLLMMLRRTGRNQEKQAREFVVQIISSINDKSDFYKKHARNRAITSIESNLDKISGNYEISTIDYHWSHFEYAVSFDHKHNAYVAVTRYEDGRLFLSSFGFPSSMNVLRK